MRGAVVAADDRLARRPGDYERFVEAITYQDGRVYADARGPKDLYSEDVESMGLFGAVISKMEVRKMQRRMRTSHRARAVQGKSPGGARPFGWHDDRLTLDPREAPLLRRAAEEFMAGRSCSQVNRQDDDQQHGPSAPCSYHNRARCVRFDLTTRQASNQMSNYRRRSQRIPVDLSGPFAAVRSHNTKAQASMGIP